ncbi:MAG: hypothetical protein M3Y06_08265, partial [Actinomycetota bacterium]|nr:hypothetical protein [Actinomycetota bacterium]
MHAATGTLLVLLAAQVVVNQLLADVPGAALHEATPVGPVVSTGQVVLVQPFVELAALATQVPDGTLLVLLVLQVRVVKLFAAVGTLSGVQEATATLVVVLAGGQAIVTQLLLELAVCDAQAATGTLEVLLSLQVVVVQPLPDDGAVSVHEDTGTLAALLVPQIVAVQLLTPLAG